MIKQITFFCLIFLINHNLQAQFGFGDPDDIRALKEKTLLVELKEPDEKTVKKYRKKNQEKLDTYLNNIDNYNESIKLAFTENWDLSKDVRFVSLDEIEEISDDKNRKDQFGYFKTKVRVAPLSSSQGSMPQFTYQIGLTNERKPIYVMQYDSFSDFNEADAIFVKQQIRNYLKERLKKDEENLRRRDLKRILENRTKTLKNMTLYIDKELMSSKLKRKMSSVYVYDYKVVSKSKIEEAIVDKTENIAYVKAIPIAQASTTSGAVKISKRKYLQLFINAETGKTLAYAKPGMSFGTIGGGNTQLSVQDIKRIVKDIQD